MTPKNSKSHEDEFFFGTATVGERGQIVIPAEARKEIGILPGDKLLICKHGSGDGLMLFKAETVRKFMSLMLERLDHDEKQAEAEDTRGCLTPDDDPNTDSSS